MKIKLKLIKIHWFLSNQIGIDFIKLYNFTKSIPFYFIDLLIFKKQYKGKIDFLPCLHDKFKEAGEIKSEYFWQDLLVAKDIFLSSPIKHVDIGSRIDGFVAHVATFREIEVFDIRPITNKIPGVIFTQLDLINLPSSILNAKNGYCDSISCLHALEHFGLGRYGDEINSEGYKIGIKAIAKILRKGGTLYLSTPIGKERVEFNANWIFDPQKIVNCAEQAGLILNKLILMSAEDEPREIDYNKKNIADLALLTYKLCLFKFNK